MKTVDEVLVDDCVGPTTASSSLSFSIFDSGPGVTGIGVGPDVAGLCITGTGVEGIPVVGLGTGVAGVTGTGVEGISVVGLGADVAGISVVGTGVTGTGVSGLSVVGLGAGVAGVTGVDGLSVVGPGVTGVGIGAGVIID